MVKFSKQLQSQLVPEWKSAFCNYWQLKKDVKQIKLSQPRHSGNNPRPSISSLNIHNLTRRRSVQQDVIQVHLRRSIDNEDETFYETEIVEPMVQEEAEKVFFARLDVQLNKVNQFYKVKEEEYMRRGEEIKLQLQKLITMKKILKLQHGYTNGVNDILSQETAGSQPSRQLSELLSDTMYEDDVSRMLEQEVSLYSAGIGSTNATSPAHVIDINIPRTPLSSISSVIQMLWNDVVNQTKNDRSPWRQFNNLDKKKLAYAEKMLRTAFVEYYRGLGLLRSFSSLNVVAFAKILKKYDKVTGRNASTTYMKVVERAYFNASDKVVNMMCEVEKLFTECFARGDRKKAMSFLRPMQPKDTHTVTFFLGIFTGCSMAFLAAFFIFLHLHGFKTTHDVGKMIYMDSDFPIFSFLSLIVLHMYMYGWNIYIWGEKRINFAFIFEFSPNTEIKYREMLLVASGLATLVVGGLLCHIMAYTSLITSFNSAIIPVILLLVFVLLLLFPVKICYQSARYLFLSSMKRIMFAPLYKVVMADFFLADQLTSQAYLFRHAEYIMCYYIAGRLGQTSNICSASNFSFLILSYVTSLLPYWWRLLQCLRRWSDEHDKIHLANGGKYFAAMVTTAVSLTYRNNRTILWMVVFIISSILATSYQLYWDFVVDWGLLRTDSKNFLLRDELMLENKSVYFVSMVFNFVLRLAWLQSLVRTEMFTLDRRITDFLFACLEVIRRGHWNFYRLENEHLNNVGKFRAVKTVPLPFRAVESDI